VGIHGIYIAKLKAGMNKPEPSLNLGRRLRMPPMV